MLGDPDAGEAAREWVCTGEWKRRFESRVSLGFGSGSYGCALCGAARNCWRQCPKERFWTTFTFRCRWCGKASVCLFDARARAWDSPDLGATASFPKVRTLSGNYQLVQLAPWLLRPGNPIRFEFVSHKLLRLAVPCAGGGFGASIFLSGPIYRSALALQILFYGLSLLAGLRLSRGRWRVCPMQR